MEDFILVFRRINENCLLGDLDLHLNPQDPTRICWCLTKCQITTKMFLTPKETNLLFSESYFLYIFITSHFPLLYWVEIDSCTQIIRKDRHR